MRLFFAELRNGWRNLVAATIGMAVGVGTYTSLSSLFFRALEQEFRWSKALAAGSLISVPLSALALPIVGSLVDHFGVRRPALFAILAETICYVSLSNLNDSPARFYGLMLVMNVLACGAGPATYTRLIVGDFKRGRGAALAISLSGIAIAAAILPQVIGNLIAVDGWRAAYRLLAGTAAVGGAVAIVLMRDVATPTLSRDDRADGLSLGMAVQTPAYWALGIGIISISAAAIGVVSQFQSLLIDKGFALRESLWLLTMLSLSVIATRLVIGVLFDRYAPARTAAIALLLAALGPVLLLKSGATLATTMLAICLLGLSIGAEMDLMAFFASRLFGLRRYTSIYASLLSFHLLGIAAGGIVYGAIHDRTGTYGMALALSSGLLTVAASCFVFIGRIDIKGVANGLSDV